jgi:uncharacterized protein YukE
MGSFSGMDVDEVERLAARLDLQAKAVAAVVGVVDAAIAGLTGVWSGEDLDAFRAVWHQTHRPKATAIGDQLSGWVTELRRQAVEQRVASGASHEDGGSRGLFGGAFATAGILAGAGAIAEDGPRVVDLLEHFGRDRWSVGRYPKRWASMLSHLTDRPSLSNFLRYKKSSVFHFLNQNHAALDTGSRVLGVAGMVSGALAVGSDVATHDYTAAGLEGSSTFASALKSSRAGYLYGVVLQIGVEDVKAAQQVDWSPAAMSDAWEYMRSDPLGAAGTVGQVVVHELPGRLLNIFD